MDEAWLLIQLVTNATAGISWLLSADTIFFLMQLFGRGWTGLAASFLLEESYFFTDFDLRSLSNVFMNFKKKTTINVVILEPVQQRWRKLQIQAFKVTYLAIHNLFAANKVLGINLI